MKCLNPAKGIFRSFFFGFLAFATLQANTIVVPPGGDIQAAIDAVSVGGTVKLEAGIFALTEQLFINTDFHYESLGNSTFK